jgi:hypothetical protein
MTAHGADCVCADCFDARFVAAGDALDNEPDDNACTPTRPCGHCADCADLIEGGPSPLSTELPPDGQSDEPPTPSSWEPVDLTTIGADAEQPRWLRRSDGLPLLYPRRIHWISGEPETAKSWVGLTAASEVLNAGGRVAIIDYEDDASGFLARCAALGIDAVRHHQAGQLRYIQPSDPIIAGHRDHRYTPGRLALADLCAWQPDLAVIDGVTAGMDLEGLDPERNREVATWVAAVARPLARAGAAVPCLDHVTKSREARGRWAIGAQHKLAAIDGAAYLIETVRPVARAVGADPIEGLYRLTLTKDRRGHIRGHTATGTATIADIPVTAFPDGGLTVRVEVPGRGGIDEHQRRVVEHLAIYPGTAKTALRALGNSDSMDTAVLELIRAGDIRVEQVGAAHRHYLTDDGRDRWHETIGQ